MNKNIKHSQKDSPFIYKILKPLEKHRLQKVAEMIEGDNLRVLEVGCNDGKFLHDNKNKWRNIVGVDIEPVSLNKAKEKNYGIPAKFYQADYGRGKMPFNSSYFDIVISIATLQYVYDLELLFHEVYRVLKTNGILIFEVPNAAVFWRRVEFLFGKLPNTSYRYNDWDDRVLHYFTCADLKENLLKKNFIIEEISCSGIFDWLREKWPGVLGADLIFVCRKTQ